MATTILEPTHDSDAELLLEAARARTGTAFDHREVVVEGLVAVSLVAVAVALAVFSPGGGTFSVATSVVLIVLYAAARQVGFEIATGYTCPVILVLVPMLFLLPPQLVPAHVPQGCWWVRWSRARAAGDGCPGGAGRRPFVAQCRACPRLRRGRGDEPGPR